MTEQSGLILGRYQLINVLGRGRLTQAYRATRLTDARPVVVKVFHAHLTQSEAFLSRLGEEIRRLIRLRHPHILPILDFGMVNRSWFTVVDYLPTQTLRTYLAERGPLLLAEALTLTAQLAEALAFAHRQGVDHHAVSSENVLFKDHSLENVVLSDFGLVDLLQEGAPSRQSIKAVTGSVRSDVNAVDSKLYVRPAVIEPTRVDSRRDLYDLGLLFIEMLTGQRPAIEADFTVNWPIQSDRAVGLYGFRSSISTNLTRLFKKLLSTDSSICFQSADALLMTIQALQRRLSAEANHFLMKSNQPLR